MSQTLNDFFVAEAGEYLEELERVVTCEGRPDLRQLFRLARGVRGSAEIAQVDRIVAVAAELEKAVRRALHGEESWDDEFRGRVRCTVADLHTLVQSLPGWGAGEEARVHAATARWRTGTAANGASPLIGSSEVLPIEILFFDDAGPHVEFAESLADVLPIESLLFEANDALRRALSLRPRIERLASGAGTDRELRALLAELFDLVELGAVAVDRRHS